MSIGTIAVVAVFASVAAFFVIVATRVYNRYRGVRVVTCPENEQPTVVKVDAGHAAFSAAWDRLELRLENCSRWEERGRCAEPCLKQIAASPADCLMRSVLARWFEDKHCLYCRKPVHLLKFQQQPGLRSRDGCVHDLDAIEPQTLVSTLNDYEPVCFDCLVAEQFRRQHPELVTDKYKAS